MADTKIEWATKTWNPITGCSPISAGCEHCYAARMANRLRGRYGYDKNNPFQITFHENRIEEPLQWKKPQRVFVCSMGDLFHDYVHEDWIDEIMQTIKDCPQHTFMILTKRPENINQKLWGYRGGNPSFQSAATGPVRELDFEEMPSNIWLGVTAENQETADERIPILLSTPAAKHFVSVEPMLGPVNFDGRKLDWIICGGETGPGARPVHPEWVRDLRDQCQSANVPFFFKSWGAHVPTDQWESGIPFGNGAWSKDKEIREAFGRDLEGREWNEFLGGE